MEPMDSDKPESDTRESSPPLSPGQAASTDELDASPSHQMRPPDTRVANGKKLSPSKGNGEEKRSAAPTSHPSAPLGSSSAPQQPKVVQTAFIHKLYNMLEDNSITHLINWSESGDSFMISPSSEFSKVLSTYFKHTNVSSFVRQLNMYGFHKVSDVFQSSQPETPLWEFKHGNGSFKRGDLSGLRDIKRRASRHTLIHRDSFSAPSKATVTAMPVSAETAPETIDAKVASLDRTIHELRHAMSVQDEKHGHKVRAMHEHLLSTLQINYDLSNALLSLVGDRSNPLYHNVSTVQATISSSLEQLRRDYEAYHPLPSRVLFPGHEETVSPLQRPQADGRLEAVPSIPGSHHPAPYRPLMASRPRDSYSGPSGSGALVAPTSSTAPHQHMHPMHRHPLAATSTPRSGPPESSYLGRRHTVDLTAGHAPGPAPPPRWLSPTNNLHGTDGGGAHDLPGLNRDAPLRHVYQPPAVLHRGQNAQRGETDAESNSSHAKASESRWHALGGRIPFKDPFKPSFVSSPDSSAPPTRRSSMANLHMVLNHNDVLERKEDEYVNDESRKRQRVG